MSSKTLPKGEIGASLLGVSKYRGKTPKSSILIGFSIINHPFWGTTIFGNTRLVLSRIVFWCLLLSACIDDCFDDSI